MLYATLKNKNWGKENASWAVADHERAMIGPMMELMMRDPDRVISVEKFMNKVWGIDSEAEINVVWTFLSYLRRKLQNIGADIVIKASRGQGYHLEARDHDQ